ncbi:MAG: glycerol-3-phosphate dehydrogenase/oxidase [Candidatus Poribacteria bacterium]|nr:glycerol-3-phosphate dehydrogenase/oxidase [Candidatus Poribacteria bacterium]
MQVIGIKRRDQLQRLSRKSKVKVLIIGAGINGIGTFRDLALQGIDVLMVDQGDFCSGTSATSSHMVHGGIRYLENGEFRLVREAVQERNRLLQLAPHYVKPLPTVIPIFNWHAGFWKSTKKFFGLATPSTGAMADTCFSSEHPRSSTPIEEQGQALRGGLIIKLGLLLYDLYSHRFSQQGTPLRVLISTCRRGGTKGHPLVSNHRFQLKNASLKQFPELDPNIVATAIYYDAVMLSPERLAVELITDTEQANPSATALNYVSMAAVAGTANETVVLRDEVSGQHFEVQPELVINATGPWIDLTNQKLNQTTEFIGGTKGSHLVLNHPQLRSAIADHEILFENDDGRIVLIAPFFECVIVGTTDIRVDQPETSCTKEEIDYLLHMISRIFPQIQVDQSQILYTFSGVRPLPTSEKATGQISRDHQNRIIEQNELGFPVFNLIGGKWTTFRAFAEQVTDQALSLLGQTRYCHTGNLAIGGGRDYPQTDQDGWIAEVADTYQVDPLIVERLFCRYGTRAKTITKYMTQQKKENSQSARAKLNLLDSLRAAPDYYVGEVRFIAEQEKVVFVDDFIRRRSTLAMRGQDTPELRKELATIMPDLNSLAEVPLIRQAN